MAFILTLSASTVYIYICVCVCVYFNICESLLDFTECALCKTLCAQQNKSTIILTKIYISLKYLVFDS